MKREAPGLPEEVFLFVSRSTPLVNVDLLIRDDRGRTLLTWRSDDFDGSGWHVPGGIVRFKERLADRIARVAKLELGAEVRSEEQAIAFREFIHPDRDERGHFLSFLYRCELTTTPRADLEWQPGRPPGRGEWAWHAGCPPDLLPAHQIYREFLREHL